MIPESPYFPLAAFDMKKLQLKLLPLTHYNMPWRRGIVKKAPSDVIENRFNKIAVGGMRSGQRERNNQCD